LKQSQTGGIQIWWRDWLKRLDIIICG
jgi:hypothetical protein